MHALIMAAILLASASVFGQTDANVAPDPDFESDPAPFYFGRGPCSFSWASDVAHSPTRALRTESETSALCRWLSETSAIAVNPGESYDVSAWMRTAGAQPVGVLSVKFWTATGVYIPRTVYAPQALSGPREWTQLSLSATAPPGAAFMRIELRLNGPGMLWADDVRVTAGAPVAKSPPVIKGILAAGEILRTTLGRWTGTPTEFQIQWIACSHEEVPVCEKIPGATLSSYTLTPAEVGKTIQILMRATGFGRTGEALSSRRGPVLQAAPSSGNLARNVDIELDPSAYYFTNGPCLFDWTTSAAHSAAHALRIVSDTSALCRWFTRPTLIAVEPGARYTVSAWLQTENVSGNGRLGLNFWTRGRGYIAPTTLSNRTVTGTQGWTELEAQATAPPGAAYLRVELRLNGPGELWADDLSVTRASPGGGTTTTSSTVTPTSTTTSTSFGGGTCCNGDSFLSFSTVTAPGDCGDVRAQSGSLFANIQCGSLYTGGGGNYTPLPVSVPDLGTAVTAITSCAGPVANVGGATSSQTASIRNCTSPGCLLGAPLAVPNPGIPPVSLCVLTTVSSAPSGTVDCSTGATDIALPLGAIVYLTGDTATDPTGTIAGIQPCPLCSGGTCIGGPNNGMSCTAGTTAFDAAYPTSHDCPPAELFDIGTLPIAFGLTTGTVTWNAVPSGTQLRVFSGYCRDADDTGSFENPANQCLENGMAVGAGCSGVFEACEQRTQGAFGPNGGANRTITAIGSAASILGGPAPATLVSIFSIPPIFNPTVDSASDLPGPGAVAIPGTAQSCAVANPCP